MAKIWSCSYPFWRISAPEAATSSPSARGPGRPIPRAIKDRSRLEGPTRTSRAGPVQLMTRRTKRLSDLRRSSTPYRRLRSIRPARPATSPARRRRRECHRVREAWSISSIWGATRWRWTSQRGARCRTNRARSDVPRERQMRLRDRAERVDNRPPVAPLGLAERHLGPHSPQQVSGGRLGLGWDRDVGRGMSPAKSGDSREASHAARWRK